MKKFALIIFMFIFSAGITHGATNIHELWDKKKTNTKKRSYKKLWEKPAKKSKGKAKKLFNTLEKIENSKSILQETSSMQKEMNQQLEKIAKTIERTTLESIAINKVLRRLKNELKKSEIQYNKAQQSISEYGSKINKLNKTIDTRHDAFVRLLTEQFSLTLAMKNQGGTTVNSIIGHEVYEALKKKNAQELAKLKNEIDISNNTKKKLLSKQNRIRKSISSLRAKRDLYDRKKKEKKQLLAKLARKEEEYRAKLKSIMQRQKALRQTLAKLNILRQSEIMEAKRAEEARKAELKRRIAQRKEKQSRTLREGKVSDINFSTANTPTNVKQYGSSYQAKNIQAYRGAKTISPLARARVVKKFGSYIDPIYKIKIFNDNIVLRSPVQGAKVRNVLNGKVVYIGQNSMLGKVVIVEHGNRLHTIYAALDRISPLIHVGSRVKKGVIIGRIKRKLIFQATQNSKYINPLRLIRL